MKQGDRMVRLGDGMKGVVQPVDGAGLRVIYFDRGERCVAGKQEKWERETPPPQAMRQEEKLAVAFTADRMLRSLVNHEPTRWWEPLLNVEPFDPGLVDTIVAYLGTRK